jgi:hypothetical protein
MKKKTRVYAGLALHALVASVMIFSAIIKFIGPSEHARPFLGIGELANALLLLIPRTMSLGVLITSAGWGAVIAFCVMHTTSQVAPMHPLVPTGFLVMTWIGGYLRDSRTLFSFSSGKHANGESKA